MGPTRRCVGSVGLIFNCYDGSLRSWTFYIGSLRICDEIQIKIFKVIFCYTLSTSMIKVIFLIFTCVMKQQKKMFFIFECWYTISFVTTIVLLVLFENINEK